MKQVLLTVLLVCCGLISFSQQINRLEYYTDTDPGTGNGIGLNLTAADSVLNNISLITIGLNYGFHVVYVRYRYDNGRWGQPEGTPFFVFNPVPPAPAVSPVLAAGEYFIDTDPGIGQGTAIAVAPGDSVLSSLSIPTGNLSIGFHMVYVRYKDQGGNWGNTTEIRFNIADNINPVPLVSAALQQGEYFLDTDPGIGNGTPINFPPADSVTQTLTIPTAGLALGYHSLYIRFKDQAGKWGNTDNEYVVMVNNTLAPPAESAQLTSGEYFVDTDPGPGNGTGFSFPAGDSVSQNISIPSTGLSGIHTAFVRMKDAAGRWGQAEPVFFNTCNNATVITTEPVNINGCLNGNVTFTVTATGTNLSYQWQKNNVNLPFTNTPSYQRGGIPYTDSGYYRVIVNGTCGSDTSVNVFLSVNGAPVITTAPVTQNICQGTDATFTVAASGNGNTYQWKFNNNDIPGATNTSYTVSNAQPANQGNYKVSITNSCNTVTSGTVAINFVSIPTVINTQTLSHSLCAGLADTFRVNATGTNLSYQWKYNSINIPGATAAAYILPNVQDASAGNYQVLITGTCGAPLNSQQAVLSVNHPPGAPASITGNTSICGGIQQSYTADPAATATYYTWTLPNGWTGSSSTSSISVTPQGAGTITVRAGNTCGIGLPQSLPVSINANFYACYCKAGLGGNTVPSITGVNFCTLKDTGRPAAAVINPNYGDYYTESPKTTTVSVGGKYDLSATFGGGNATASVWIDYNRDGVFASSEWTQITTGATAATASVQIPDNALTGLTGMRIRSRAAGNTNAAADACTGFAEGETIDYQITIVTPAAGQASGLVLSNIAKDEIKVTFARGNPKGNGGVLVVAAEGAPVSADPVDNVRYSAVSAASVTYTDAALNNLGNGKVVYNTNSTTAGTKTFTLKGLTSGSRYYFQVFEYDTAGVTTTYIGTPDLKADTATLLVPPALKATNLVLDNITANSFRAHWKNGGGTKRLVVIRALNAAQAPTDNTVYTANSVYGAGTPVGSLSYAVYNGTDTTVTITNLQPGVKYHIGVFEYNGYNALLNYASTGIVAHATTILNYVALPKLGVPVLQTFNGAGNIASGKLPAGWYMSAPALIQDDGTSSASGVYSFGLTGNTTRTLGTIGSGSFGAKLINTSEDTITSIVLQYDGRQWRKGASAAVDSLIFEYSLDAADFAAPGATWTRVNNLKFASVQSGPLSAALNGNAAVNFKQISASITGLNLLNGDQIWIRWRDNTAVADGLSVDNLNIIPFERTFVAGGILASGTYNDLNVAGGTLTLDSTVTVKYSLNIENNAILNIDTSRLITQGYIYGTGTLSGGPAATLSIGGTAMDQRLRFTPGANTLYQLNLAANASAILQNAVNITAGTAAGAVRVGTVSGNATLTTGGFLTLKSDSLGTATIPAVYGVINGNITMERWLQTDSSIRLIAHPFTTNIPVSQLSDDVSLNVSGGATQNLWHYNPVTANPSGITDLGSNDANWMAYTGTAQLWNRNEALRLLKGWGAATLDMSGAPNQGDLSFAFNGGANDSFVVIGNPYPAGVKIGMVLTNATDGPVTLGTMAGSAIWTWDPTKGTAGGFTSISSAKIPTATLPVNGAFIGMIPPGSSATLVYHESYKTTTGNTKTFFREANDEDRSGMEEPVSPDLPQGLEFILSKGKKEFDNTYIYFDATASAAMERADAPKLTNPNFNFCSIASAKNKLSVDVRPFETGKRIDLDLATTEKGKFTLTAADFNLPAGTQLYLVDDYTLSERIIGAGFAYDFVIDANSASQGARFHLRMGASTLPTSVSVLQMDLLPNPAVEQVTVRLNSTEDYKANVRILSMTGQEMISLEMPSTLHSQLVIPVATLTAGMYMVEVTAHGQKQVKQLLKL